PTSPSSSGRQTLAPTTIASCSSRRLSSRTLTCAPALGVCNEHRPAGHADHRQGAEILPARSPWLGRRTGAEVPAGARAVGSRCRESSADGGEAMSTDTIDTKARDNAADTFSRDRKSTRLNSSHVKTSHAV